MLHRFVLLLLLGGCAFFQGNRYTIALLETSPEGAGVYKIYTKHISSEKIVNENTQFLGYTPLEISVPKDANIMVVLVKKGYKNQEFIIRTGYRKIYSKDGEYHTNCLDEEHYGWVAGGMINNLSDLLAPNIRKKYCTSDRYEYEIKLESLEKEGQK